jgi:hypothetical protein
MGVDEALGILSAYIAERFPDADTALLCGSTAKGAATATSDLDLIVICPHLPNGAHRLTEVFNGALVEAFIHDPDTLFYFLDRARDRPIMASMIADGLPVSGLPGTLLSVVKAMAADILAAGPPPLTQADLDRRRYLICNLVDDLLAPRSSHQRMAIVAELYANLGDFILRAAGEFSAGGKALAAALETRDPAFAIEIEHAFAAAFATGDTVGVRTVVDRALEPYGGWLVENYAAPTPPEWRSTDWRGQSRHG